VTLIFYKVGADWWKEPALNLLAAAAQFSSYTHVEIAIGEGEGLNGMMSNVARIFNDPQGVVSYFTRTTLPFAQARGVRTYPARSCVSSQELCQRTGKNPQVCNATHLPHLLVIPTRASTDRLAMLPCSRSTRICRSAAPRAPSSACCSLHGPRWASPSATWAWRARSSGRGPRPCRRSTAQSWWPRSSSRAV